MIFFWRHDSALLHVLSALFVINGGSAFLAHYYGTTNWHNIDGKSMLLAVWIACSFILAELLDNFARHLSHNSYDGMGCFARARRLLGPMSWLLPLTAYWWIAESNATIGDAEFQLGAVGIAVPLGVCVIVGMAHVWSGIGKSDAIGPRSYAIARNRFVVGCVVSALGVTAWTLTENLCDRDDAVGRAFRWVPGHAIWHVTMAFGMTSALLFGVVIRADSFRTMVYVRMGPPTQEGAPKPRCHNPYFFLLPKLNFDEARGIVAPIEPQTPQPTRKGANAPANVAASAAAKLAAQMACTASNGATPSAAPEAASAARKSKLDQHNAAVKRQQAEAKKKAARQIV